jgi:hypothetical protein
MTTEPTRPTAKIPRRPACPSLTPIFLKNGSLEVGALNRDCLKTRAVIFVNDPIFDVMHFDEVPRRIRWCKNEF